MKEKIAILDLVKKTVPLEESVIMVLVCAIMDLLGSYVT
jgi:hypothetical protein